ncbi:hypothetical protein AB0L65_55010 [Nonomuraea sp. NPDC052116]|uniref:hypothetical protein n=1 Tax=Nonomuraea sp. NPDC052116 TaxID=3155665 RepID=UPI00342CFEC0
MALLVVVARSSPQDVMAAQSTRHLTTAGPARLVVELARTLADLAGALLLVNNTSELAARTGASPERVGLTLVACAAALPMLILAIRTQRRGDSDLLVGAVLVGTLVNSLAGGALVALTAAGAPSITPTVNVAMVGISGFICALLPIGTPLARGWSVVLLVVYALVLLI